MILLLACASDPELERFAVALTSWEEGKQALEAGRADEAATAFARARAADPDRTSLGLWEAKALADAGKLTEADVRISEVILRDSGAGIAFYNRAAWRVRAGRTVEAATDLREALRLEVRSPFEAAADPDFLSVRGHPAFHRILPENTIVASVEGPTGSIFLGSRASVELRIAGLPGLDLGIERRGPDPGCLSLVRIVEDEHVAAGVTTRRVTVDLEGRGPCAASLGPFVVTGAASPVELEAVAIEVEAPLGAGPATGLAPLPAALPLPSRLAPEDAGTRARRVEGGVACMGRPDRAVTGNGRRPDVLLEWRVDGQTRAAGGWWLESGPVELVARDWRETVR